MSLAAFCIKVVDHPVRTSAFNQRTNTLTVTTNTTDMHRQRAHFAHIRSGQRHRLQQLQLQHLQHCHFILSVVCQLPLLLPLLLSLLLLTSPPTTLATRYNRQSQGHATYGASSGNSLPAPPFPLDVNTVYIGAPLGAGKHHTSINNDVYSVADSQAMTDDYMAQFGQPAAPPPPPPYRTHPRSHDAASVDNTLVIHQPDVSTCQTMCACKWKGGKQTVECIDRLLIQIPGSIDPSTQVLDMSGNKLQTLSNEQFVRANLLNLQKLYLRNCRIGEIEPETFKRLTNLVELDLSHNLLVVVPSLALSQISSLRELSLASNHIHKIEANSFASVPALNKLDLSHCDIQSLAPMAFDGLKELTLLRLNGNKLNGLPARTIETLSKLHGIELHDNPWVCDCRMRDTKLWLMQKNIPYPVPPICSGGPERIVDRTISELQVEDFACKPEMLPISHYVEATMGENASVVCRAKAIPAAVINWYWNGRLLVNNSAFSAYQRVHIFEDGQFEKRSRLVLTNAQETDSSEFYCVAENRAGNAEANFTLHVSIRAAGMASLGSGQIVGLSAALVALIICVLLIVMYLLMRVKRQPYTESKTPNNSEAAANANQQNAISNKAQPAAGNGSIGGIIIANGAIPNCIDTTGTLERKSSAMNAANEAGFANPVQKPPRLTDLPYSTTGYDNNGSVLSTAPCFISPTASAGNNPDLINDTKRFGSDEFVDLKIPAILTANLGNEPGNSSGEYSRAGGCDSLYPSGLWEHAPTGTCSADDLFMKRYTDKTPIIESNELYDLHERGVDYFSKTFPRTHCNNLSTGVAAGGGGGGIGTLMQNPTTSTAALMHGSSARSTASTTTTNLSGSSSGGGGSGYPNDYGLPLVPGAEHQHNHHLQMHPLQQLQQQLQQQLTAAGSQANFNRSGSPHFSSRTLPRLHEHNSSVGGSALSASRSSPTPAAATPTVATTVTQSATGQAHTSILPNGQPINAKTIRVWQKGGVPVLPPVTALKRALTNNNRSSPDEGYQEGCGTDV